jgi:excisionase family DNA binding protein
MQPDHLMTTIRLHPPRTTRRRWDNAAQGHTGRRSATSSSCTGPTARIPARTHGIPNEMTPPPMDDDAYWKPFPDTLSISHVAKILIIREAAVLIRLKNGVIPGHLIVGSWIIFKAEVRAWLESTSNQLPAGPPTPVDVLADYADEMTYGDLVTLFGKTRKTIYSWLNDGAIPAYHVGNRWIIRKSQLRQKLLDTSNQRGEQNK